MPVAQALSTAARAGLLVALWLAAAATTHAQQATIGAGANRAGSTFSEQYGVQWGVRGRNFQFQFGGPPAAPPPGGFSLRGQGSNGWFNFAGGQSSVRSNTSTAASVTVMNGQTGYFFDGAMRPFVTGVIPVVGDRPIWMPGLPSPGESSPSVLQQRISQLREQAALSPAGRSETQAALERPAADRPAADPPRDVRPPSPPSPISSAAQPGESLAEIRRRQSLQSQSEQSEAAELLARAIAADESGRTATARYYYQAARRKATGSLAEQIDLRLGVLESRERK
jgi:hypothetical protein